MDAKDLRSRGDSDLAEKLLAEPLVTRLIERLEREQHGPKGVRRHLLATSLRLTEQMMPDVHEIVGDCRARLGIEIPLEVYVYPDTRFNAACIKPEDGRLFIMLSSGLLEAFPAGERRFVIGHELGHHLFGHHDIPIGYVLGGSEPPPPDLALRLFAWSRYAEISADRAGAFCAGDPDDVARALFRLASGLRQPLENIRIDEFLSQLDDLQVEQETPGQGAPEADWFSTHPFSPLRLRALKLYFDSQLASSDGFPVATLEARVQTVMALMEPSYLDEKSESAEAARRLLFAGAIAVVNATDGISETETELFEKFFGEGSLSDNLDIDAITQSLDQRIADANQHVPHARRIQVLRDLCIIARAEDHVAPEECEVIEGIASKLEVPVGIINETLCGECDLD